MNIADHLPYYYMIVAKRGYSPRSWVAFALDRKFLSRMKSISIPVTVDPSDASARLLDAEVRPLWKRLQEMDHMFWLNHDINKSSLDLLKIEPVARSVDTTRL